jgi:quercetin dioxygenase-like cupin family protein
VAGGVLAIVVDRALSDSGPMRASETVSEAPVGTLEEVPQAPLRVVAERIRLPAGFESTHYHGGPTFNFVDFGRVEIEQDGTRTVYGPGAFFFEPEGKVHTIRVLDTAQLAVLRLLPPGAEATTEVR